MTIPHSMTTMQFSNETWMNDLSYLGDRPLRDIVIPGAHDAGTYQMENRIDNNSSQCQSIPVYEQLVAGARYLDLRAWADKDGKYWMYHGTVWTHVKLEDVLSDIKKFLDKYTSEIVIATLLIDEKTNVDAGFTWACQQVSDYIARSSDVGGKSLADVTPNELRAARRRLVFLRSGSPMQLACMDREGVYGDSLYPSEYVKALDGYRMWSDKMWILHLGIPYKGDIHNTMPTRAKWNADEFIPRFRGEGSFDQWRFVGDGRSMPSVTRRLNIINVDFIQEFGWVDAIVGMNLPANGTLIRWPAPLEPKTTSHSYTWTIQAVNSNGMLHIATATQAPFRAQQGQIHVYSAQDGFPADPDTGKTQAWAWDNDAHSWNTGLKWTAGMCIVWVAQKSANGPHTPLLKVVTSQPVSTGKATYTWHLRAAKHESGNLVLEGDSDAPFRAQQGQLHVYSKGSAFPSNPEGKAEKWNWDNDSHPWHTGLEWSSGRHVAWVAQESPNGDDKLFVRATV